MVDYVARYRKIVDKLIKNDFQGLKNRKIFINEANFFGLKYSAGVAYFLFFDFLTVNRKCRNYPHDAITGLMAHELSHLEEIKEMKFMDKIVFGISWLFTKKGKADFETLADKIAIEKGYGKYRHKLAEQIEKTSTKKHLKSRLAKGYLSSKQIKQYAIKIRKWR